MSLNSATFGCISLSGFTMLACLFSISNIYNDVQNIWTELDNEMDSFRASADDLWKDMLTMGAGTPSNRQRRQAYAGYGASSGSNKEPNEPSEPGSFINQPIGQVPHLPEINGPNGAPSFPPNANPKNCRMLIYYYLTVLN